MKFPANERDMTDIGSKTFQVGNKTPFPFQFWKLHCPEISSVFYGTEMQQLLLSSAILTVFCQDSIVEKTDYIYIYNILYEPSPPPQWYGPPGPCPRGGVRAFITISTIATTIITPTTPTTPRAPPTTTNAAATTDYCCCCCCCCCGYCCCYYYDYYYILLYIMSIFTSTSTSTSTLHPNMYVHMYAPTTATGGGGYLGGG